MKALFLLLLTLTLQSQAQNLYVISENTSNDTVYLSTANPTTGNINFISTTSLAPATSGGISAFDPINKRYFFFCIGFFGASDTLYTVDATTGNLLSKVRVSTSGTYTISSLQYSCQDSTLYIISESASSNLVYLSKVDPITGTVSFISPSSLASRTSGGISALDPVGKRYFFINMDLLYTADLTTGNLLSSVQISTSGTYSIGSMQFNSHDSMLYVISENTSSDIVYLSTANPTTGNISFISSESIASSTSGGISALDPINRRYFFISVGFLFTSDSLYTADLTTGNLLNQVKISTAGTFIIGSMEFEKTCAPNINGIEDAEVLSADNAFPNPFSTQLAFTLTGNEQTTVSLYDFLGQQVLQQSFTNSTTINTEQMQNGIYFYELRNSKGRLETGKVVKQ